MDEIILNYDELDDIAKKSDSLKENIDTFKKSMTSFRAVVEENSGKAADVLKEKVPDIEDFILKLEEAMGKIGPSISIYEEILPLGSIVDLDEDMLKNMVDINEVKSTRVMITHRMIPNAQDDYMAYRGVYYPYGIIAGEPDTIAFTPKYISNIVKLGYSDEENDRYVHTIKESYILEHDMHSYSVTSPNELLKLHEMLNADK